MADLGSVVVVGVGPGLGAALARRFAAAGHHVALVSRNGENLQFLADEINGADDGSATIYAADAADEAAMVQMFATVEDELGPIEVAVHNAGGRFLKEVVETSTAEFEALWRTSCLGALHTGREAARRMIPRGKGSILFTGGRGSHHSPPTFAAFSVAKHGVRALAEALAREVGPKGIHVAHFTIEATIDKEPAHSAMAELAANDGLAAPEALAEIYYQTHLQPKSTWAFDVDLRPWREEFFG
jgi:NAD(P)-dependent dehydrogenase (short-subunit alcohol dehydrogenase family)